MRITPPPSKKESMRTENIFRQFYTVALWDGTCPTYHFVTPNSTSNAASGGVNLPWLTPVQLHNAKLGKILNPAKRYRDFFCSFACCKYRKSYRICKTYSKKPLCFFFRKVLYRFFFGLGVSDR
jgi:hypothetical protein